LELEPIDLLSTTNLNVFSEDEDDHEALHFLEYYPIPDKELTRTGEETRDSNSSKAKRPGSSFENEEVLKTSNKHNKRSKK
jgi:hypothetical protein